MATITERQPGVFFARVWLPPTSDGQKGRQVGKVFCGGKKDVRAAVSAWEAELRGTAPSSVGATVADLLRLWQEAKQFDWQPTSARDYAGGVGPSRPQSERSVWSTATTVGRSGPSPSRSSRSSLPRPRRTTAPRSVCASPP